MLVLDGISSLNGVLDGVLVEVLAQHGRLNQLHGLAEQKAV